MSYYRNINKDDRPSYVRAPGPARVIARQHHPFELATVGKSVRLHEKEHNKKGGVKDNQLERNNTDFPLKLFEYFRGLSFEKEYDFLKYYQNITREYSKLSTGARGLLIYYTMGMGKSILAVALVMEQIKIKPVVMILAKALHDNMRAAIHKYVRMRTQHEHSYYLGLLTEADLNAWIDKNFSFVSLNASNMAKQVSAIASESISEFDAVLEKRFGEIVKIGNLDGKTIVVDEAHNFMRMITNGSQNGIKLYDMIMSARGANVYLLSGTPISNDPFELVPCMNMIAGRTILPTDYAEFTRAFVSPDGYIANKGKFMNRIFGLVSHVSHYDTPGAALFADPEYAATHTIAGSMAEFPEQKPIIVERIPMTAAQYTMYQLARDKEMDEGKSTGWSGKKGQSHASPALTKPKSGASSSYRVKSRQLSNWAPATSAPTSAEAHNTIDHTYTGESCKYPRVLENLNKHHGQTGILYSQFVSSGGLGSLARFLEANGWEEVKISSLPKIPATTAQLANNTSVNEDSSSSAMPNINDIIETGDAAVIGGMCDWFTSNSSISSEITGGMEWINDSYNGGKHNDDEDVPSDDTTLSITSIINKKTDESSSYVIRNATVEDIGILGLTSAELTHPFYAVIVEEREKKVGVFVVEYTAGTITIDNGSAKMCAGRLVRYESLAPPCISRAVFTKLVEDASICVKSAEEFVKKTWPGQNIEAIVNVKKGDGWRIGGTAAPRRFAIISGDIPAADRTSLAVLFNDPRNTSAEMLDLLMVSSTGAEGLDLKNGRHVHLLEPYWTWNRILQVIARLVRNGSHKGLPKEMRDVTPYIYLAIPPSSEPQVPTTDTELYDESLADHGLIESFHEALRESSIECMINGGKNCRQCAPTNEPLYSDDLFRDIRGVDPCRPVVSAEVVANDVTVAGVVYHYLPDSTSVFGWKVLRKDPAVDSWRKVPEHDPDFLAVIEVINPEVLGIGL